MEFPSEINPKARPFFLSPDGFQRRRLDAADVSAYLAFYDLPRSQIIYSSGYVPIQNNQIFVQQFLPEETCGLRVFLSHGYCDHSALFRHVISMLLEIGVEIVTWDYPGFGLSTGKRGYTASFIDYTNVIEHMAYRFWGEKENIFVGHSAGCAYSLQPQQKWPERFNKVLFLAPLIRCVSWSYVKTVMPMAKLFLRSTRRAWKRSSSDKTYYNFYRFGDPLVINRLHVSWPNAMLQWEKSLKNLKPIAQEIVMFQGLQDQTVDWQYNKEWLKGRFEGFKMYSYEKGLHHLQNESDDVRKPFLQDLKAEILN